MEISTAGTKEEISPGGQNYCSGLPSHPEALDTLPS